MRVTLDGPGSSGLTRLGLYDEAQYATRDMHAVWQFLRQTGALHREHASDGEAFYAATRYKDVREVLGNHGSYSSEYSTMLSVRGDGDVAARAAIHLTDPPLHSKIKRIFAPLMTVTATQRFQHGIAAKMAELFESIRGTESFDFCQAMVTLPMTVTGMLMGIPEREWPVTGRATVQAMGSADVMESDYERRLSLFQAHTTIMSVLGEVLEANAPHDSVTGRCPRTATVVDDPARDVPLLNAYAFLMGANPTIPQTINQTLILLASNEELWSWFTGQQQTDQRFIDEALRWASPINHVLRRTTVVTRLAGTELPAGSLVTAWLGSANRDEDIFVKAYDFIPDRHPNQHLTFGLGVHRCIGQHVAVAGLKTFFDLWRANVHAMSLSGEPRHLVSNFLNGVTSLPLNVSWK